MAIDIENIRIFRIIHIQNLEHILRNGMYCKNACKNNKEFVSIGSKDVITRRDKAIVECFSDTVVNDYVPFYFSVRTPMLYNIITGHGVPAFPQEDIVYLCCKIREMATDDFQWCYSNGNAATAITKFFKTLDNIENNIDWHSVYTNDFRDDNADGDEDRIRKKHAEFLVKHFIPSEYIKEIVVLNEATENKIKTILNKLGLTIEIKINPKFYF